MRPAKEVCLGLFAVHNLSLRFAFPLEKAPLHKVIHKDEFRSASPRITLAKIRKRKGPIGPVGIKNSWKYEKDLIILNEINDIFTINQVCYLLYC